MRRYLLGQASIRDQRDFERQYLADGELFEELVDEEEDLIHSYLFGKLDETERKQFEEWFLQNPERLARVRLTRTLLSHSPLPVQLAKNEDKVAPGAKDEDERVARPQPPHVRPQFLPAFSSPGVRLRWAGAAALSLALVIGIVWITIASLHWRRGPSNSNSEHGRTGSPPALQQNKETAGRPDQQSLPWAFATGAESGTNAGRQDERQSALSKAPSFKLTSDVTRGGSGVMNLVIPHGAPQIIFHLSLERDDNSSYTILLESDGKELWRSITPLHATGFELKARVPARILTNGDYRLIVKGVVQTREAAVAEYPFRIVVQ